MQHIESVTQTHYAKFLEFSQPFADWAQLLNVQLELLTVTEEQMPRQLEQPVQIDKRQWWNQLDHNWEKVFKQAISIKGEPTDSDLEKIISLQTLDFSGSYDNRGEIASLEPLRTLTNLQKLYCSENLISDLKPLRALTNYLQTLFCDENKIGWWNMRKFKKAVPNCKVNS